MSLEKIKKSKKYNNSFIIFKIIDKFIRSLYFIFEIKRLKIMMRVTIGI